MNKQIEMKGSYKRKAKDINLKELYEVIRRRLWIVVLITVIAASLGAYYSYSIKTTPQYQSSSRIIISANAGLRTTLQVIIKDSTILDKVVQQLNLPFSSDELAGKINVESIDESQVVSISVIDTDPERAANIANTIAKVFKEEIPNIVNFNKVRLLSDAKVNPWSINSGQSHIKIILIAFIAGLIISLGLVFLLDSLDDTLKSNQEVEAALGLPVLGRVSKLNRRNLKRKNVKKVYLETRGETIGYK